MPFIGIHFFCMPSFCFVVVFFVCAVVAVFTLWQLSQFSMRRRLIATPMFINDTPWRFKSTKTRSNWRRFDDFEAPHWMNNGDDSIEYFRTISIWQRQKKNTPLNSLKRAVINWWNSPIIIEWLHTHFPPLLIFYLHFSLFVIRWRRIKYKYIASASSVQSDLEIYFF